MEQHPDTIARLLAWYTIRTTPPAAKKTKR